MTAPAVSGSVPVRPYRPGDREAIGRIACDTALYGRPIDPFFPDRRLVADILVSYYLTFEPSLTFVVEQEGRVVGYLTGCVDTRAYEARFVRAVFPRVLWRTIWRGHWGRRSWWTLLGASWMAGGRWAELRPAVVTAYPAHCHVNLEPGREHHGAGSALLNAFLDQLRQRGVRGIHILTATEPGKAFFTKSGFTRIAQHPAPNLPGLAPRETWVMAQRL